MSAVSVQRPETLLRSRLASAGRIDWLALVAVIVVGSVVLSVINPRFHSEYNAYVLLRNFTTTVLVGLAQMSTLAVGEMNLSVGALGGLIAVALGGMLEVWHLPLAVAIVLAFALGTLSGAGIGLLIVGTRINGFIITLAALSAFTGISTGLTQAIPFYNLPSVFTNFGQGSVGPFPYAMSVTILVTVLVGVLFARTVIGRQLLAVGGNKTAAGLSGVPLDRTIVLAHTLSGSLIAVAAILGTAQLGSAQPTIGDTWMLLSFAIPVIGGTLLTGGHVSATGAFLAAAVIALINNGLILANVSQYWVTFLLGVLILAAVGLGRFREARARRGRSSAIAV
jgi:ribose transport system permease protein